MDHVILLRWVQRFTPELIDAARRSRHTFGDLWFVDQRNQVIDVYVSGSGGIASAGSAALVARDVGFATIGFGVGVESNGAPSCITRGNKKVVRGGGRNPPFPPVSGGWLLLGNDT